MTDSKPTSSGTKKKITSKKKKSVASTANSVNETKNSSVNETKNATIATSDVKQSSDVKKTSSVTSKPINQPTSEISEAGNNKGDNKDMNDSVPLNSADATQLASEKNKKPSNVLSVFAIILSIAALAAVALSWYQNQVLNVRSESNIVVGITEIGGQVSRIGDSVSRLQTEQSKVVSQDKLDASLQQIEISLDQKRKQLEQQVANLVSEQSELIGSIDVLNNDLKSGANAYTVDEVAQLLKLANNSLVYSGNAESALNALTIANSQLNNITDPRYRVVKSKIAEEIAALKNINIIDIEGISASLNAISSEIPNLPLENEPEATDLELQNPEEVQGSSSGWRGELKQLWYEVKSTIQIQKVEQAPKPLLAPTQRYFLDQNLQLMLTKSDIALLQQKPKLFQQGIDDAIYWLKEYFDLEDAQVKNVLTQLTEIKQQEIIQKLPSITASYTTLQNIRGGK